MKIVVTGGLGYIGSKITKELLSRGHEVVIFDNHTSNVMEATLPCEYHKVDITDFASLQKLVVQNVDAVLHLAAQSSGPKSFEIPDIDIQINVIGTLNILRWCIQNKVPRIIFASSFVVYGDNPDTDHMTEHLKCYPKSIYALSKYAGEHLLEIYSKQYGLRWNALRMFNVYGPGQDLTRTNQGMVGIFMGHVLRGSIVPVQGRLDRYRDLVYIDDVVQGWIRCLNDQDHPNRVYNLGSGKKTTISTLIETIIHSLGKTGHVRVEQVGATPGDILGVYADISAIRNDLDYQPQYDIKHGIDEMARWVRSMNMPDGGSKKS